MHLLCNEFKTFSSINGAIAIHKFQEQGFNNNNSNKIIIKSLPKKAYNLKTEVEYRYRYKHTGC